MALWFLKRKSPHLFKPGCFVLVPWIVCLVLGACDVFPTPIPVTDTPTPPQITLTPSRTIVWFPATSTPTPLVVRPVTSTPAERPAVLGDLILADPLNETGHWPISRGEAGSIAFGNEELTFAVAKPKGYLFSLRDAPLVDDFYLEVTTITSLCRENDSFGVIVRAVSARNYYRFSVSCGGRVRPERGDGGYFLPLLGWMLSGEVAPGPQMVLRLGVLGVGKELRFYINGVYQYSLTDPVYRQGSVGLFALSGGENALTVSYKGLEIYSVLSAPKVPLSPTLTRPVTMQSRTPQK